MTMALFPTRLGVGGGLLTLKEGEGLKKCL